MVGRFSWGIFVSVISICISGNTVFYTMCILASITQTDLKHRFHVLFLVCKEMFRLEKTYAVWQYYICYEILLRREN